MLANVLSNAEPSSWVLIPGEARSLPYQRADSCEGNTGSLVHDVMNGRESNNFPLLEGQPSPKPRTCAPRRGRKLAMAAQTESDSPSTGLKLLPHSRKHWAERSQQRCGEGEEGKGGGGKEPYL